VFSNLLSCADEDFNLLPNHKSLKPQYDLTKLHATTDTIHFRLNDTTYNSVKSFNVFTENNKNYISFYDERSQSVVIYDLQSKELIKTILLRNTFKNNKFYKTTVYVKGFDSIFVNNFQTLYLLDKMGQIKRSIHFLEDQGFAWGIFSNTNPLVVTKNMAFATVRPYVKETSHKSLKKWKVLYKFNLKEEKATLLYHYPKQLQENLYGHRLLDYSYCFNNDGRFVFSFPADTSIYETDLVNYHVSYFAKSQLQDHSIQPVSKEDLEKDKGFVNYLYRDSYGAIYFDVHSKRYLRAAYSKINEKEYETKEWRKKQRLIIFDEKFKIIGESPVSDDISLNTIFFSGNGDIYARILPKDENALYFIRLEYSESIKEQTQLSKNEK
jgi:hypothetical protein